MLKISGTGIRLTRGDSARFAITLAGREVPDGTKALFTVKKKEWRHEEPVIELETAVVNSKVHVLLRPEETNIDAGDYVWDLRVFLKDGDAADVLTPMERASFCVAEAIGRQANTRVMHADQIHMKIHL